MKHPVSRIRRNLLHGLMKAGYSIPVAKAFTESVIQIIDTNASLPANFFDIPRALRIHANRERQEPDRARKTFIDHPKKLLEIFDLPLKKDKKYPQLKYHPTREERLEAAIAVRNKYGSLPNSRSCKNTDHEFLPENSIGWTYLLRLYYQEKGLSFFDDVTEYERRNHHALTASMPSDYRIYKRAMLYMAKNNALPPSVKIRMQGKTSPFWEDIYGYLEKRGMTLGGLIVAQQDRNIRGTAHRRHPSLLPSNDDIARWAIGIRYHQGIIPAQDHKFTTMDNRTITAKKLKQRLIKERKTQLVDLMNAFEKANPLYTPPLQARRVFLQAATSILESGTVPDQRKNNIPIGEFSALGINKHFTQGHIEGAELFRLNKRQIRNLREFLVATGLVEKKRGELIPASPDKIQRLIAAYTP